MLPAGTVHADERELVARLRAGDEAAFALIVRSTAGPLLAAARRFLRDEEDARDAVQEAFLKAHQSLEGFQGSAKVSTWLHRIVVTTCLMKLRTRRRHPEEPIEPLLPSFLEDGHATEPSSDWEDAVTRLERRELSALVRAQIARLPESLRVTLLLRDIEEMEIAEIAAQLELTPNAVKIRLHRARQALRTLLDPHLRRTDA